MFLRLGNGGIIIKHILQDDTELKSYLGLANVTQLMESMEVEDVEVLEKRDDEPDEVTISQK